MDIYRPNPACGCIRCRTRGIMFPALLIIGGVLFLLDTLNMGRAAEFERTWPIILLAIGGIRLAQVSGSTDGHVQPPAVVAESVPYRPVVHPSAAPYYPPPPVPPAAPPAESASPAEES